MTIGILVYRRRTVSTAPPAERWVLGSGRTEEVAVRRVGMAVLLFALAGTAGCGVRTETVPGPAVPITATVTPTATPTTPTPSPSGT
jgi:hypothetical protein